jgi:hypothetical protein
MLAKIAASAIVASVARALEQARSTLTSMAAESIAKEDSADHLEHVRVTQNQHM